MEHPAVQTPLADATNFANAIDHADSVTLLRRALGDARPSCPTPSEVHDARARAIKLAALRRYSDIPGPEELLAPALTKLNDAVEKLSSSLDMGLQHVNSKLEKLEEKIDARFAQLEQRVGKIEQKVEKIEWKLNLVHQEAVWGRNGSRMDGTSLQYEIVPFNDGSDPVETLQLPYR